MLLAHTVNKVHGRKALCEHQSMPQMFCHPALAQEAKYSHDGSGNLQQASGNCAYVIQGGLSQELIWASCFTSVIQKWRIFALHIGCQDVRMQMCQCCQVRTCEAACWQPCRSQPEPFFLASRSWERDFQAPQRTESQRLLGDSSDGTFPSELYSANAPAQCFDLNSSLNNCIHFSVSTA